MSAKEKTPKKTKSAANSGKAAKPRGKPWPKGTSGNPKGAPKRGESWAEIIKKYGDMTPEEIANAAKEIAGNLKNIGGSITMKEAVVIRVYAALMFDPNSSLLNTFMERTDGKVVQPIGGDGGPIELIVKYATDDKPTKPTP